MKSLSTKFILLFILCLGFVLRSQFINWDNGYHLHPDERMLIMVADKIHFWDKLNPEFFNYGSLPIYILKGLSQFSDTVFHTSAANYDGMLKVGRYLSVFIDTLTIFIVYKISELIFATKKNSKFKIQNPNEISLLAAFFYAIAFFPIQNSHFFVVDIFLTFFISLTILTALLIVEKMTYSRLIWLALVFAAAVTTKITAMIFLPFLLIIIMISGKENIVAKISKVGIFIGFALFFSFIFMPYGYLDFVSLQNDLKQQTQMRTNPYIFPYTLQYVGTLPYWYFLKNILLWGLGPVIGILATGGLINLSFRACREIPELVSARIRERSLDFARDDKAKLIIFLSFYLFYFILIGSSAVKFMRYMLPIYPFLVILAAMGVSVMLNLFQHLIHRIGILKQVQDDKRIIKHWNNILLTIILCSSIIWTSMFLTIYSQTHTRITATDWINQHIPAGSTIAIEHWDDRLPLYGQEQYQFEELTLYDQPDGEMKWDILNQKLGRSDYIILASNRLYVPLQKLTDCSKYKECFPKTAHYYDKLFNQKPILTPDGPLMFQKVAEFISYPMFQVSSFKFQIKDDAADESFTVYDHPKIIIFKKI